MSDVYVRRRIVVVAGAASLIGLLSFKACGFADGAERGVTATKKSSPSGGPSARSTLRASTAEATPTSTAADLTAAMDAALAVRASDVSITAYDLRTGVTFNYHPSLTLITASIMKVLILTSAIQTRRAAGVPLSALDKGLAHATITESDNNAASTLFRRAGRASGVQPIADALGMKSTVAHDAWGLTTTTAADQVTLMRAIAYGHPLLRADDRAYMLGLMGDVDDEQAFGIGTLPAGTTGVTTQVKNGWLAINPRRWHDNSIGHVKGAGRDYVAAILSTGNATDIAGRALVTTVAEVLYEHLGH